MQKSKRRVQPAKQPTLRPVWQRALLHPYLLFLLMALLVWLPDGFDIGPVGEGWSQLGRGLFGGGLAQPLRFLPASLGLVLSPGSFIGFQAVLLCLLFLHAILFYGIAQRLLPRQRLIALACACIALFHCADHSYFRLGALGLQFSLVAALASCVSAMDYLEQGKRRQLASAWVLQLIAVLSYPGFVLLMLGVPVAAWLLRRDAAKRAAAYPLALLTALPVAVALLYVCLPLFGAGRVVQGADLDLVGAMLGIGWAAMQLVRSIPVVFAGLQPISLILAVLPVLVAYSLTLHLSKEGAVAPTKVSAPTRYRSVAAALLAVALLSYLPYALSTARFMADRSLLAAGMFAYSAILVLVLQLAQRYLRREVVALIPALLAGWVVLVGFQQRTPWVEAYRTEERLLGLVAQTVPQPHAGATLVVKLHDPEQARKFSGFYDHEDAFTRALRFMYADDTLDGGFYGFGADTIRYTSQGVAARAGARQGRVAVYPSLVLVGFPADSDYYPYPSVLMSWWVVRAAGPTVPAAAGYDPSFGDTPVQGSRICSVLEQAYWPTQCFK